MYSLLLTFFLLNPLFAQTVSPSAQSTSSTPETTMSAAISSSVTPQCPDGDKDGYTVNFEDLPVTQLIRFLSQISDTNFVFDSKDVKDLTVTIVSEEQTSAADLMTALLQVLRMNDLSVVEEGKNVIIFKNQSVSKVSTIISDEHPEESCGTAVVTRVFRLYNLSPDKVQGIIKPLISKDAVVEVLNETRHLIVSDITSNTIKIAELLDVLDTPNMALDIAEYKVKSAIPQVLVKYAQDILQPLTQENPFQMIPQQAANKIFIVSTPYLIGKAVHILESLDTADIAEVIDLPSSELPSNNFFVYKLKYRNGQDIANAIHTIGVNLQYAGTGNPDLISAIYSLEWIEVNNSIVISGTQDAIDKVVQLMDDLDTAPSQVYIEVLIIDTTLANSLNFGVEWIALANEQNKLAFASGLLNSPPATAPAGTLTGTPQPPLYGGARTAMNTPPPNASRGGAPGTGGDVPLTSGFGFGIIGNIIRHNGISFLTLGSLINALEAEGDTIIVLNPKIMAQDTQQANFFVGSNIPYQTTSTVIRDTGSVTQNIQYEDIGVQLQVTPQVGPDNIVTLQIDQSVSDIISSTAQVSTVGGSSLLLAPTTSKTLTTTRVLVPNGCFLVMSGHVRDRSICSRTGIPCLGGLPLIGPAFSTTNEVREKRNLIMFIQPHVVTNIDEGLKLTNQEGYDYNWESHPSSIEECCPRRAPECETYPPLPCPVR